MILSVTIPAHELNGHPFFEVLHERVDASRASDVLLVDRHKQRRNVERQPENLLTGRVDDVPDARPSSCLEHMNVSGMLLWNMATLLRMPGAGIAAKCTSPANAGFAACSGQAAGSFSPKNASIVSP